MADSTLKDDQRHVRSAFDEATWIGFDLDDTLHDFSTASSSATEEVLSIIVGSHQNHNVSLDDLRRHYKTILREGTSSAFVDGRTSHDYRRERFTSLLSRASLLPDTRLVDVLLSAYEERLSSSLTLKDRVPEFFNLLKGQGKKVMVITEGPQDAQERTVEQLLGSRVDALATTNSFGVSKVDGLFARVLGHFDLEPRQMVFVGDSLERDVVPARKEGIFTVLFDEERLADRTEASYTISSFRELIQILAPSA